MTETHSAGGGAQNLAPQAGPRAYGALFLLGLTYAFSFLDRQILAILAEPIRLELDLSDTQVGALTGFMFAIFYTAFGLPIAWLADRSDRVRIIAASCAVWSAFTALCGAAGSFWQLALARIGVGVGEAGGTPPAYSLISDLFPPARRPLALALYSLGVPAGVIAGGVFGGWIGAHWGWRTAFVAVGAPGVAVAIAIFMLLRDPRRTPAAKPLSTGVSLPAALAWYVRNPLLMAVSLAGGVAAFASYGILNWTPALLMRAKGMSLAELGAGYSWVIGLAMGAGIWAGGFLVERLSSGGPRPYAALPAAAFLLAAPALVAALAADDPRLSLGFMAAPAMLAMMYLAPTLALVQDMTPAHMRATVSSMLLLILNVIGLGGGPLFVGVISDALQPAFGEQALVWAMAALTPVLLLAAGSYAFVAVRLGRAPPAADAA